MCGLLALYTIRKHGLFKADIDEFKMMLHLTAFRGKDSTGIAGINLESGDKPSLVKAVGAPNYVFNFIQTDDFFKRAFSSFNALIGHTRYATRGEVNATNAHPYREGHITLAHNGVISNFDSLKDKEKHRDITVDSHLIARLFSETSPQEVLEKIEGAYVFIWFDEILRTFNIARNFQRPLFMGNHVDQTMLFASERETLEWNASRNKTILKSIEQIEPHKIYSWTGNSITPTITEYKPYAKVYPTYDRTPHQSRSIGFGYDDFEDDCRNPPISNVLSMPSVLNTDDVKVGDEIVFTILDADYVGTSTYLEGMAEEHPKILFKSNYSYKVNEALLTEREFLKGKVRHVTRAPHNSAYDFIAYTAPIALLMYKGQPSFSPPETVKFKNVLGEGTSITFRKAMQMLRKPCAWCTVHHPTDSGTVLEKLIYNETEENLVCYECAATMHEQWARDKVDEISTIMLN